MVWAGAQLATFLSAGHWIPARLRRRARSDGRDPASRERSAAGVVAQAPSRPPWPRRLLDRDRSRARDRVGGQSRRGPASFEPGISRSIAAPASASNCRAASRAGATCARCSCADRCRAASSSDASAARSIATESSSSRSRRRRSSGRGAVALIGPTRSGKTTAAIGGILDWEGPAVLCSMKADLLGATARWRGTLGDVKVFDPSGVTGRTSATWSPLRAAADTGGAVRAARAHRRGITASPRSTSSTATSGSRWPRVSWLRCSASQRTAKAGRSQTSRGGCSRPTCRPTTLSARSRRSCAR